MSAQSADIFLKQSTLFAGISAQLLVFFKSLPTDRIPSRTGQNAILWLCYASLFFNAGATLSSLFLIDVVGELPFRSSNKPHLVDENRSVTIKVESKLLKRYGVGRSWVWLRWHCEFPKITVSSNFAEVSCPAFRGSMPRDGHIIHRIAGPSLHRPERTNRFQNQPHYLTGTGTVTRVSLHSLHPF